MRCILPSVARAISSHFGRHARAGPADVLMRIDTAFKCWRGGLLMMVAAVAPGQRGPRWLMVGCLRSAHEHDPAAVDLAPHLTGEPVTDLDRAASRAGVRGVLRDGIAMLAALAEVVGPAVGATREDVFGYLLPAALAEHDLLRRTR